jgi:hypothetical protein
MEFFIILIGFIVFDLAALRWGIDSGDGINSREWQRRYNWALRMVDNNRTEYVRPIIRATPGLRIPPAPANVMLNAF